MNLKSLQDELGCTFNGIIHDIPRIRIDNFKFDETDLPKHKKIRYFFLSHPHTDHLEGFRNLFDSKFMDSEYEIICTNSTKVMLSTMRIAQDKFGNIKTYKDCEKFNRLKPKPINTTFCLADVGLNVTLIPNYHCIGSTMILIETLPDGPHDPVKRILYTGDVRFDELNLSSLKFNANLLPFIRGIKELDFVYLDTTFNYREYNINILDNYKSMERLSEMIEEYPKGTKFQFLDSVSGFEDVWCRVFHRFPKSQFVLDKTVEKRFRLLLSHSVDPLELNCNPNDSLIEFFEKVLAAQDTDPSFDDDSNGSISYKNWDYKFYLHSGTGSDDNDIVKIKHCIDISEEEFEFLCMPKQKIDKSITQAVNLGKSIYELSLTHKDFRTLFELPKYKYMLVNNDTYFPMTLKFIYSRHSALNETQKFIRMFDSHVNQVYPMTQSLKTWLKGFTIERYYGNFCNGDIFHYDEEMAEKFGACPIPANKQIEYHQIWALSVTEIQDLELLGVKSDQTNLLRNGPQKSNGVLMTGNLKRPLTRFLPKNIKESEEFVLSDTDSDGESIDPSYQAFIRREERKQRKQKILLKQQQQSTKRKLVAPCHSKKMKVSKTETHSNCLSQLSQQQLQQSLLISSQDLCFISSQQQSSQSAIPLKPLTTSKVNSMNQNSQEQNPKKCSKKFEVGDSQSDSGSDYDNAILKFSQANVGLPL